MTTPDVIPLAFDVDGDFTPETAAALVDTLLNGERAESVRSALRDLVRMAMAAPDQGESTEAA